MNFNENLERKRRFAEQTVISYLPDSDDRIAVIFEAMEYSVTAGGKRLRPVLMKESFRLFGGKSKVIEPFMAALEMIHTYSLVHDDLPAMDNDELRRGKPTTWKKYGECMAILAGDALLNYAFSTALRAFELAENYDEYKRVAKAVEVLSAKAGVEGMLGGQVADILSENDTNVTADMLIFIHQNKTAALMEAAMMIGAILAGASDKDIHDVEKAARCIGLAFQIQDDILDITGSNEALGKPIGSDERNDKLTYVKLHGLNESKAKVKELSEEAMTIVEQIADENRTDGSFLMTLIETLIKRDR